MLLLLGPPACCETALRFDSAAEGSGPILPQFNSAALVLPWLLLQMPLRRRAVFVVDHTSASAAKEQWHAGGLSSRQPSTASATAQAATRAERLRTADSDALVSPFASLARGSPSAASIASNSSGAGSAAGAALLNSHQGQSAGGAESSQSQGQGSGQQTQQQRRAGAAPSRLRSLLRGVWRGLVRFVLWPLFGYDPSRIQGEWLPSDAYGAR